MNKKIIFFALLVMTLTAAVSPLYACGEGMDHDRKEISEQA
jgi:hypothetical protein